MIEAKTYPERILHDMKITNQKVSLAGIVATLLFTLVVLSDFPMFFPGLAYSFLYLIIVPGFFIQRLLRIRKLSFFESITYIVGLSISLLYFVGITTNSLNLFPGIPRPLNVKNSLIVFDICILSIIIISHIREYDAPLHITMPKVSFTHLIFSIIPFFFPILSISGAKLLDSGGPNLLSMVLLSFIAVYVFLVAIFMKKLEQFSFELPIYLTAVSLLLMFSFRSQYIIGWDIYQEYKVFLLTESQQLWSMAAYRDPYNACLSITILPTLFHYFTKVDNPFVFKVLYQCTFALAPVAVYALAKNFAERFVAFLSAFFFISTVVFFLEMPAIVRQEMAFLFFGLLLHASFNTQITSLQKRILFIIFGFSIVLSHYATTYILVVIFGFTCVVLLLYKKFGAKIFHVMPQEVTLGVFPVIIFIAFAYIWLGLVTNASSNLVSVLGSTVANITNFETQTFNTSLVDQIIKYPKTSDIQQLLLKKVNDAPTGYKLNNFTYYPKSTYKNYIPTIIYNDELPLFVPYEVNNVISTIVTSLAKIIKVLIIIGFIAAIILFYKKLFPPEYSILSLGFTIVLLVFTSIPAISFFYPVERLEQQTLFFVAISTILSISWLIHFIPYKIRMTLITVFFIVYFLYTTTFISQVTGGQDPQVFLNNSGRYYNEIYLHPSEIASIHWLFSNNEKQAPIFADVGSSEKMVVYSNLKYLTVYVPVFPSVIDKNSYVYSNYGNTLSGIGIIDINDTRMEYNFPGNFLDNNKNLIYNNYKTRIYK